MRITLVLLATVSLAGCSSTRVLEGPLATAEISEINSLCADGCAAEVVYDEPGASVDINQDPDSVYRTLWQRDVTLRMKDSSVMSGRVSRLTSNPQIWLVGQTNSRSSLIDTVHFRLAAVDSLWVAGRSVRIKTRSLHGDVNLLHVGSSHDLPLTAVSSIKIKSDSQRTLPLTIGATVLMGAVGGLGGIYGAYYATCSHEEADRDDGCDDSVSAALVAMLAGISLGTAGGAHLGNRRRGNFGLDLAASLAGIGAGVGLGYFLEDNWEGLWMLSAVPPVLLPVVAEHWLTRRRARNRLTGAVVPAPGGAAFSLALTF